MECVGEGYINPNFDKKKRFSFERFLDCTTDILLLVLLFLLVIVLSFVVYA